MRLIRALQQNEEAAITLFCDVVAVLGAVAAIRMIQLLGLASAAA